MSISSGGVLYWAAPVKGSYKLTVTAQDLGLTGTGSVTLNVT
jgi:hypothetical protein